MNGYGVSIVNDVIRLGKIDLKFQGKNIVHILIVMVIRCLIRGYGKKLKKNIQIIQKYQKETKFILCIKDEFQ